MKKKLLKALKVLFLTAVALATLVGLVLAIENYRGKRAWEKCKAELEAKGEKLDWAALAPPPVPDDQNFFRTPLLAPLTDLVPDPETGGLSWRPRDTNAVAEIRRRFASLDPAFKTQRGSWRLGEFTDLAAMQSALRGETNTPNADLQRLQASPSATPQADLVALLGMKAAELAELRAALDRPHARAGLMMPESIFSDRQHLAAFRELAHVFVMEALAELANGNPAKAAEDVIESLKLGQTLEAEAVLIDALVQIAITETSIQPLWEGLARREWREPQLAKFEVALAKLDFVAGMARTLRFERAYSLAMMDLWRTRPGALAAASGGQEPGEQPKTPRIPSGWVRLNQVEIARMFQDFLIPVFNTNQMLIDLRLADRLQVQADERLKGWSPYKALARMLLPAVSKASQRAATAQTTVNLARIAVALERFRLANGSYPEQLAALAPGYLPAVPHEVLNGKPYQYRREAPERFQLYSVGLNLEDDGGRVAVSKDGRPNSRAAGADWVWQYAPVTNRVIITGTAGM